MKIVFGFNAIMPDGMGSAAMNLLTALHREGIPFQTVHPWKQVKIPEFMKFRPLFLTDTEAEPSLEDSIEKMIEAVNGDPECTHFSHFGSPNWGAIVPYLRPDIKLVVSVHSITPSAQKIALAYKERTSIFVPVSWKVEERLKKILPAHEHHKIIRVPNAIDVGARSQKDYRSDNVPLKILFMGRIEDVTKGCDKIPRIARRLKDGALNFQWDMYGYFHWGYEKRFFRDIERWGVGDVVTHKGCLTPDQLVAIVPAYDVMVMPSNHEGLPLTLLETMAASVPCVVSRLDGVTDRMLEDGVNGLLVGKNDIVGFADAVARLLKDKALRQSIGLAGYQRVREWFDLKSHGEKYRYVLEQAMKDQTVYPHLVFDANTFRIPGALKPHMLARILPLWLKKILKRII